MPLKNIPEELRPTYEKCLTKVRAKGGGNEYAICYASVVEGASAEKILERFAVTPEVMDVLSEFGQKPTSETIAIEPFKAIDPNQPLKILPVGKFYRGDRVLNIDDARAREIINNFQAGLPRYGVAVNVEHGDDLTQPGKVGRVKSIKYVPGDGIYADKIEYTDPGKKLLGDERYDAPSPEVVWTLNNGAKYQDPETGKWYDNVLVGLALTNSPFFGGHVAVFSADQKSDTFSKTLTAIKEAVTQAIKERFGDGPGMHDVHIDSALGKKPGEEDFAEWDTAYINSLPDSSFAYVEDGEKDGEGKTTPRSKRYLPYKGSDGKVDLPHLRNALARLNQTDIGAEAKSAAQKKLNAAAKGAGVGDKENSSMAKNAENFQMDHGDMTSHHGSDGKPDAGKIKAALGKDGLSAEEKKHLQDHMDSMNDAEDQKDQGADEAAERGSARNGGNMAITVEEFTAVKAQSEQFKAELETAKAESKKLAEQFAAERLIRRTAEFTAEAENFTAMPTKAEDLGAHLLWLNDADTGEKKEHFTYFKGLLETSNKALAQSALFSSFATERAADNSAHPFLAEVSRIQKEKFADKPQAEGYTLAFKQASAANPTLAKQYVVDKQAGRV